MKLQYSLNSICDSGIKCEADSPVSLTASYTSDSFDSSFSEDSEADAPVSFQSSHPSTDQAETKKTENHHQDTKGRGKTKKVYTCQYCQKVFSRPSALQTHTYTHTAEKPFQCLSPNCGRYFSVVSNLRRHFKVHQKTQNSNKLSSEDRLRCVKQLMLRSSAILSGLNQEILGGGVNNDNIPYYYGHSDQLRQQKQKTRNQHYPILPAIDSIMQNQYMATVSYSCLPSPPLRFTPTFENQSATEGDDQNLLFGNSLFNMPQLWPIQYNQAVDPDSHCSRENQLDDDSGVQSNMLSPYSPYVLPGQLSQKRIPDSEERSADDYFSL